MIYRRLLSLTTLLSVGCYLLPAVANAEPKVGRMPDGTPYRTDAEGNQLADHIAELEVTIVDLRKQVAVLEDELEKDQKSTVRAAQQVKPLAAVEQPRLPDATIAQELERTRTSEASCQLAKGALETEVQRLRLSTSKVSAAPADCTAATTPLREQITKLQTALMESPSKENLAGAMNRAHQLEAAVTKTNTALGEREQALKVREDSVRALEAQLASANSELTRLREDLATREGREKNLLQQVAQLEQAIKQTPAPATVPVDVARSVESPTQPIYSRTVVARAALEQPSEEQQEENVAALDNAARRGAQQEFRTSLGSIQSLILKRKELLDSAKSRRREVSIKVQPLVTKRGESLDTLRVQVDKLSTMAELSSIRSGLEQIKGILEQDVSLLKRLS